jgi:pantothenate synthetase
MRQVKRIVENLELNSVQANVACSLSLNSQSLEELQQKGRITERKAAQFTRAFDTSSDEDAWSRKKLQLTQRLNKQIQASQQLVQANEKLVKDAIERENKYIAELERNLDQVELLKQQSDSELAKNHTESKRTIENLIIQSLERLANFEQIQLNLAKVLSDALIAQSPIEVDALTPSHTTRRWYFNPLEFAVPA